MKKGFTLIELLVVVAIISILTIISVSQFNTAKIKARDTQRKADIDSVAKALILIMLIMENFRQKLNGVVL